MPNLNQVNLIGHLGHDPSQKEVGNNKVTEFSLATSEKWTDKTGEVKSKTEWHKIVIWGKLGDVAKKYLHKGDPVFISGKITYDEYEKDGKKQYFTKIVGLGLQLLSSKAKSDSPDNSAPPPEDDLPF